jgi:hypothetical protein
LTLERAIATMLAVDFRCTGEDRKVILREYSYRPRWTTIFLAAGFFGLCAALFVYLALTNERPLILNGILPLSPVVAKVLWWGLAGCSLAFVVVAGFGVFVRVTASARIAIADDGVLFPAGRWSRRECHVLFTHMTAVKRVEVYGEAFLYVYADGLRYTIIGNLLPNKSDFDVIAALLNEKVAKK